MIKATERRCSLMIWEHRLRLTGSADDLLRKRTYFWINVKSPGKGSVICSFICSKEQRK